MSQLPGVVIIIGQSEEIHAVKECRQLGIPTVTLLDSNCDPSLADWFLPGNDDSVSTLRLVLSWFQDAIQTGQLEARRRVAAQKAKQKTKQKSKQNTKQTGRGRLSPSSKKRTLETQKIT